MSYVKKNLLATESVVYQAKTHWAIFLWPLFLIVVGIIAVFVFANSYDDNVLPAIGVILAVIGVIVFISRLFIIIGAEYALTDRRLIMKQGVISKDALELQLHKCEGLSIRQGIFGSIFGYGTVVVTTGGATNKYSFIANPNAFKKAINHQIDVITASEKQQ